MSHQIRNSKNGVVISYVLDNKVYVKNRYFKRVASYYREHGYKNFVII